MREKCGPISGIRKDARIEELQKQDMFEGETVALASDIYSDQILKGVYISPNHAITGTPATFIKGVLYSKSL